MYKISPLHCHTNHPLFRVVYYSLNSLRFCEKLLAINCKSHDLDSIFLHLNCATDQMEQSQWLQHSNGAHLS